MEPTSQIVSRIINTPQASIVMEHEEVPKEMFEDEKTFRKELFDMSEMVKVLYEERNSILYGESLKPHGGKGENLQNGMEGMVTNHHSHLHHHPHLQLLLPFPKHIHIPKGSW